MVWPRNNYDVQSRHEVYILPGFYVEI